MRRALTTPTDAPLKVRVFHVTHWQNLASIVTHGVLPYNDLVSRRLDHQSIAYQHLQQRRHDIEVPVAPHGTLHDYVPCGFAARPPMLYTSCRGTTGNDIRQSDIIHLESNVQIIQDLGLSFVFTDGHPLSTVLTEYSNDLRRLPSMLDWDVLCALMWSNSETDADRKRRRQAEFLIRGVVPWEFVRGIAVQNETIKASVSEIIQRQSHKPRVVTLPEWYYQGANP